MAVQIQLRRDTAANWTSADPTLAAGEFAIETDTDYYKIGDGSTAWTSLGYSSLPSGTATLASPTFTGVPAAPTASANTSTTQVATTAFVMTEVGDYLPLAGGTLSGAVDAGDQILSKVNIKDYHETRNSIGTTSASQTIDMSLGNVHTLQNDAQNTTLAVSNVPANPKVTTLTLIISEAGGSSSTAYTITWPTTTRWAAGTAPTLTQNGIDIVTLVTVDGGTIWYGAVAGQAFA